MSEVSQKTFCLGNSHGTDPLIDVVTLSGSCNSN